MRYASLMLLALCPLVSCHVNYRKTVTHRGGTLMGRSRIAGQATGGVPWRIELHGDELRILRGHGGVVFRGAAPAAGVRYVEKDAWAPEFTFELEGRRVEWQGSSIAFDGTDHELPARGTMVVEANGTIGRVDRLWTEWPK